MKILVGTNILSTVQSLAYSNHCQSWFRLGRNMEHDFIFYTPERSSIDRMRNEAARVTMEYEADYLMFVDDDILLPIIPGGTIFGELEKADADIAAANVTIRGYPFMPMFFKRVEKDGIVTLPYYEDWKKEADPTGILKKDLGAVGFSCVLIRTSLLLKMTTPFFVTGTRQTEDVYFCLKAQAEVPTVSIAVNTRLVCGHILNPEIVSSDNIPNLKTYYELQDPGLKERNEKV